MTPFAMNSIPRLAYLLLMFLPYLHQLLAKIAKADLTLRRLLNVKDTLFKATADSSYNAIYQLPLWLQWRWRLLKSSELTCY